MKQIIRGREALERLASVYPQLYLDPGLPGSPEAWKEIVLRGKDTTCRGLSHFVTDEKDSLEIVETPAGEVPVLTLFVRQDFECFLTIVANQCIPVPIPATQGASALNGVINWRKIREHQEAWLKEKEEEGDPDPDWGAEFKRFTAVKENYRDFLIVLSAGPYSSIPASRFGIPEDEWIRDSLVIRKYHECTHFYCRKKYPGLVDPVWDEVIADAVGIITAFGKMNTAMEEAFLGTGPAGYTGGRLENYMAKDGTIHETAKRIHSVLEKIGELQEANRPASPFELAGLLEDRKAEWWDCG